jgi:fatty-acyl-CoA synthase
MIHHTDGERPLVLAPEDVQLVEATPLAERDLPKSTYDLLARTADAHGDAVALHLLGEGDAPWREAETWTYADLLRHVHQAANLYLALGLEPGGVVGLLLPNTGSTYAALLGAQAVGIANPVNPMLAEEQILEILTLTDAEILVAPGPEMFPAIWDKAARLAARLPRVRALLTLGAADHRAIGSVPVGDFRRLAAAQSDGALACHHRPAPGDLAAYFHTGGTTGTPKVAPHTHANEVYMAWAIGCAGSSLPDSVLLSGLPLFHVNALHVTGLSPFMHGRPVVSLGPLGYRDADLMADFWRIIEHYRISSFSAVPTLYASLPPIPDGVDVSSLRAGAVGAAPLPRQVRATFERTANVPMLEGYGLTEGTCATSITPAFAPRAGSVGLHLPYQQVKAVRVDADGRPEGDCAPGQAGVLAIKGPNVFPGYLRSTPDGPIPDPTGKIFDGWLLTGDLGHVDKDGYVYLTGRANDLIIRGGHNIDPAPVEESLLAHPEVTGAAVVGAPDAHAGEVPIAYVTLAQGAAATEESLRVFAAEHAPEPAAAPKAVHVLKSLPLTSIGKLYKPMLVADAVRRVVLAEAELMGIAAQVAMNIENGRPRADIRLAKDSPELGQRLESYSFRYTVTVEEAQR